MATSKITLYKDTKILPEYNYKVDDLYTYLNSFTGTNKVLINDFQYQKHALALVIKVDMGQWKLDIGGDLYSYNYCAIKNSDEDFSMYYFILKKTWISANTIQLTLKMDTVNSFTIGYNYAISNRTMINRQHKDRYQYKTITTRTEIDQPFYNDELGELIDEGDIVLLDIQDSANLRVGEVISIEANPDTINIAFMKINKNDYNDRIIFDFGFTFIITELNSRYFKYAARDKQGNLIGNYTMFYDEDYYLSIVFLEEEGVVYEDKGILFLYNNVWNEESFSRYAVGYLKDTQLSIPKIDLYSEGLTPILYGTEYQNVNDGNNLDWYLIYKGSTNIDCFLCASQEITAKIQADNTITPESLTAGVYYYAYEGDVEVATGYRIYCGTTIAQEGFVEARKKVLVYYKDGNNISYFVMYYENLFDASDDRMNYKYSSSLSTVSQLKITKAVYDIIVYSLPTTSTSLSSIKSGTVITITTSPHNEGIRDINALDKTDATIVKIIKLPYCPVNYEITSNTYSFDTIFTYDATLHMLKLLTLSKRFSRTLDQTYNIFSPALVSPIDNTAKTSTLRNDKYETKLYHSDYYQPKFVYDSFGFIFQLEKFNSLEYLNRYGEKNFTTTFVMTSTINSKFMFKFNTYICDGKFTQDYYNVMPIARNNEVAIFNSNYINYIKTGYNYDVKAKERQNIQNWIGTAFKGVGAIASFASGVFTGGVGFASGIALATSFASSIITSANTQAQNEESLETKQAQLRLQSTSVYGSDDVDLMSDYTGNKAKIVLYQMSEKTKKAISDVFFFTGYIGGFMGTPDMTSRVRFNFVSADVVFEYKKNIPDDCLEDLRGRWKDGITFMHKYNNAWDWDRKYENWETSLNIPD